MYRFVGVLAIVVLLMATIFGVRVVGSKQPHPTIEFFLTNDHPECMPPCWRGIRVGISAPRDIRRIMETSGATLVQTPYPEVWQVRQNGLTWRIRISSAVGSAATIVFEPPTGALRVGDLLAAFGMPVNYSGDIINTMRGSMVRAELRFNGNIYAYVNARSPQAGPDEWRLLPKMPVNQVVYVHGPDGMRPTLPDLFKTHLLCVRGDAYCP